MAWCFMFCERLTKICKDTLTGKHTFSKFFTNVLRYYWMTQTDGIHPFTYMDCFPIHLQVTITLCSCKSLLVWWLGLFPTIQTHHYPDDLGLRVLSMCDLSVIYRHLLHKYTVWKLSWLRHDQPETFHYACIHTPEGFPFLDCHFVSP